LDELAHQMHGLSVRDPVYNTLYMRCAHRYPNVARTLPKPEFATAPAPTATFSLQTPPAPIAPARQPWNARAFEPAPPPPPPATGAQSFFCPRPRMEGCAFCAQPGHRLHECDTAIEYLNSRLATYENGWIHLPNGQPIPNDGTRHGIKNGIDAWHASRPQTQNSASRPATPIRDIPPHTGACAATASWIEEVTESHVLQITDVAAYDDGSDSDDEPIDIFEVFTTGK